MRRFCLLLFALFLCGGMVYAQTTVRDAFDQSVLIQDTSRIVALGGSVTEIVYALGAGAHLVGVDTSSTYPKAATKLPQVGYQRMLSAEGVLSLNPSLILATTDAGPPKAIAQLKASGVPFLILPAEPIVTGIEAKIQGIAQALDLEERGKQLIRALHHDLEQVKALLASVPSKPKVLFIYYARGSGALLVSGRDTAADAMIRLAGGVNAVTAYEGYKPISPEAVVAAAPEVLLLTTDGLEGLGGVDGLLTLPGLALTPAGQHRQVITMDSLYLLGMGPRTGQAVKELALALHPEIQESLSRQ